MSKARQAKVEMVVLQWSSHHYHYVLSALLMMLLLHSNGVARFRLAHSPIQKYIYKGKARRLVDAARLVFDRPIDHHPAPTITRVPFRHQVAVPGSKLRGIRTTGSARLAPDHRIADRQCRVGHACRGGTQRVAPVLADGEPGFPEVAGWSNWHVGAAGQSCIGGVINSEGVKIE